MMPMSARIAKINTWGVAVATAVAASAQVSAPVAAAPNGPRAVALVTSLDAGNLNVPTIELYRAVTDVVVVRTDDWRTSRPGEVKARLSAPGALGGLGAIPAFERSALLASRRALALSKSQTTRKRQPSQVIAPVQAMLDTLALDGAIIVDCEPNGTASVRGCGLYYYDRAMGRLLAATTKDFKIGIADASRWAPTLVQSLSQGLTAHAVAAERARLDQVLAKTAETEEPSDVALELKLVGLSQAEPTRHITALPGLSLGVARQAHGYATGIELGVAKAAESADGQSLRLLERSAGLVFDAQSKALDSMYWTLGLGVSYVITEADVAGAARAADDGRLATRSIRLRLGPGFLWEFAKGLQVGAGLDYARLVPLESDSSGVYEDKGFSRNVLGFGVRLRTIL
jgi:hypothetical protein